MPDSPAPLTLAVVSHMYPQRARESYGVFVSEQIRALADSGVTISTVCVPVPWAPWPLPLVSAKWKRYSSAERLRTDFGRVQVDFPRYPSFPRKALRDTSAELATRAILRDRARAEKIAASDAIVAHSALLDGRIAGKLARTLGVPYIVVVHGEDLYQNVRGASAALRSSVGAVLGDADAVVAVSEAVKQGLLQAFPAISTIHVVHNGVDTEMFVPAPPSGAGDMATSATAEKTAGAIEVDLGTPSRPLRVLSASHLVERKAQAHLVRAVADLAATGVALECTIAGDGPTRAALETLAAQLGVSRVVRFIGSYRHEELPALLRDSDIFALPSWDEAFGVVYLEALAPGGPCTPANDRGATEIIDQGVDGYLVPPRDERAIAASLDAFVATGERARAQMRLAAREKALRFTWHANAVALLDVVREVTEPHTRTADVAAGAAS